MTESKGVSPSILTAAMLSPESDVSEPSPKRSTSFISQLVALKSGESAARVKLAEPTMTLGELAGQMPTLRASFRNNVASSVRHAMAQTGAEYTTEVGEFITTQGRVYLVLVVTRAA